MQRVDVAVDGRFWLGFSGKFALEIRDEMQRDFFDLLQDKTEVRDSTPGGLPPGSLHSISHDDDRMSNATHHAVFVNLKKPQIRN